MKLVFDAEWRTKPGPYDLDNAEYIWCVVFKVLNRDRFYYLSSETSPGGIGGCLNSVRANLCYLKKFIHEDFSHGEPLTLIGHNILGADLEIFRRMLGVDFSVGKDTIAGKECIFEDTLVMSRVLNPDREPVQGLSAHGLAGWGVRLGHGKPPVDDWEDKPIEVYLHRCEEDVRITEKVYYELMREMEK